MCDSRCVSADSFWMCVIPLTSMELQGKYISFRCVVWINRRFYSKLFSRDNSKAFSKTQWHKHSNKMEARFHRLTWAAYPPEDHVWYGPWSCKTPNPQQAVCCVGIWWKYYLTWGKACYISNVWVLGRLTCSVLSGVSCGWVDTPCAAHSTLVRLCEAALGWAILEGGFGNL